MSATLDLLVDLIKRPSITPKDEGCQEMLAKRLQPLGFVAEQLDFADTKNLWLRKGDASPLLTFLGHTDVVPTGPVDLWQSPPFQPTITDGRIYGRGAADMKGGVACFVVAAERFVAQHPQHKGSIAIMLTSDEEGIATNGVVKAIEVLQNRREKIDWCLVGEPSCRAKLGDTIRIGRRGSLSGTLSIRGTQGHVAHPHLADNPIHRFAPALDDLTSEMWDEGNEFFPATTMQISNIHSGTGADNIIPGELSAQFNLRFSPEITAANIQKRVQEILQRHKLEYSLDWRLSGNPFLLKSGELIDAAASAVHSITGITPKQNTGGGTSDGRFIAPTGAQVIELGLLNESIHKINENAAVADLEILTDIYQDILHRLLLD